MPPTNDSYSRLCQEGANAIERLYSEVRALREAVASEAALRRELLARAEAAEERMEATRDCALPSQLNRGIDNSGQLNRVKPSCERKLTAFARTRELAGNGTRGQGDSK